MGKGERPVEDSEFKRVLKHLGFAPKPRTGTSHEKWCHPDGRMVIVDEPKAPYHRKLLRLMLNQAGISKKDFFRLLDKL